MALKLSGLSAMAQVAEAVVGQGIKLLNVRVQAVVEGLWLGPAFLLMRCHPR